MVSSTLFRSLLLTVALFLPLITESFSFGVLVAKGRSSGSRLKRLFRRGAPPAPVDLIPLEVKNNKPVTLQPRPRKIERKLQEKYASIDNLEERAFQILLDLGMVGESLQ